MLNILLKLKAGSPRKPDLMRFFSPIWIHICTSGFSTESKLSCSAWLTEVAPPAWVQLSEAVYCCPLTPNQDLATCKVTWDGQWREIIES